MSSIFQFKKFSVHHDKAAMKIGTDGVLLGAWASISNAKNILDIGSGTGLIALMVAQRNEKALITALEIEPESFLQMQHNFNISSWKNRIQATLVDFQNFESDVLFDCIISNPPFYDDGNTNPDVQRSVARHTHSLPYSILMQKSASLLSKEGKFNVIIPYENEENIIKLAHAHQLFLKRCTRVQGRVNTKIKRSLLCFSKVENNPVFNELIIEKDRHIYTEDYINLCKDFYLKM